MNGALVLMIGIPGSGKSTLTSRWFRKHQVTSLDGIREWIADDPADLAATGTAVQLQNLVVGARCSRDLLTCVDNTNLVPEHRQMLLDIAAAHKVPTFAVVLDIELDEALRRNRARASAGGRNVPEPVIRHMYERKARHVPARGAVPGFDVTRRIGPKLVGLFGEIPTAHLYAPWVG